MELPCPAGRHPDIPNHSTLHYIIEGLHDFGDFHIRVEPMTLEYVNILYVEPLEGSFNGIEDILPREAPLVHQTILLRFLPDKKLIESHFSIRKGWIEKLSHDDERLARGVDLFEGFAEDNFGLATRVEVRSVERLKKAGLERAGYRKEPLTLMPRP